MQDIKIANLGGGVNRGQPRDFISNIQARRMEDMMVTDGIPTKRTGYAAGTDTNLTGTPFYLGYHYQDGISGNKRFWAFTAGGAFQKNALTDNWTDVTNSMNVQTGLDQYFAVTEVVELDDYKNYLIICQNNTNPKTALNGTRGENESVIWYANAPNGNMATLLGANGYNASAGSTLHRAKQAIAYAEHLMLLNTHEEYAASSWNNFFYRLRWSNLAHFTAADDWNPSATGSAGYQDLRTTAGAILRGELLYNSLIIYLEEAIYSCTFTNSSTSPFYFECKVPHLGLIAPRLIMGTPIGHIFVGNDRQIYLYEGGRVPTPIGDPVRTEFFNTINMAASGSYLIRNRSFMIHFRDIHCVGIATPTGANTTCDTIYVFDYEKMRWIDKWTFANVMTGWGEWESPAASTAMMLPILGDNTATNCKTYLFNYNSTNDISTAIDGSIETQDFVINLKNEHRMMDIWFDAKGNAASASITVKVSLDGGNSWQSNSVTKTLTTTWNCYHASFDVTGYAMRFKFSDATTSKNFELGQIRAELQEQQKVA